MKRVVCIGAPGVGKTTIVNQLVRLRHGAWLTPGEVDLIIARRLARGSERSIKNMIKLLLSYLPWQPAQRYLLDSLSSHKELMLSEQDSYKEFFDASMACLQYSPEHPMLFFDAAGIPLQQVRDLVLFEEYNIQEAVLFDGRRGHLQRWVAHCLVHSSPEAVANFFEVLPLPAGVVYFQLDTEETAKRIRQRLERGDLKNWWGMSAEEVVTLSRKCVEVYEVGVEILHRRGAKILTIDTAAPVEANAEKIEEFMHSL